MSNNDAVVGVVRDRRYPGTREETREVLLLPAAIQTGVEALREGRVVSHEDVKPRLA
jgi:hypothetical protein